MKKNYSRAQDIPSAGFAAGPCLLKDTMQLAGFSGNNFTLGQQAMLINEGMINYIVNLIAKSFNLERITVGLLGMAFKADTDDIRASLSYKLKKLLKFRASRVLTTDPHVKVDPELLPVEEVVEHSDILVLCVPHTVYRHLDLSGKIVVDIWGYFDSVGVPHKSLTNYPFSQELPELPEKNA